MNKETFFTPYQRQNHTNVESCYWSVDFIIFKIRSLDARDKVEPTQTPAPKYLLEAHYEYNPELIEDKKK